MTHTVAIITFHCSYNFGSALQAYALQSFLQSKGYEAYIIDYFSRDFEVYRMLPAAGTPRRRKLVRNNLAHLPRYLKRRRAFRAFWKTYFRLTKRYTYRHPERLKELNDSFDAFICGSDQIWNLDCTRGVEPAYFLRFADADKKKISYAPSLAKAAFRDDYDEQLAAALTDLNAISVREESTVPVVSRLCTQPVTTVCDPTLLTEVSQFPMRAPKGLPKDGGYIFVYMLGVDKELIKYADRLSRETELPICYVTGRESGRVNRQLKGVDLFGIAPDEFLYALRHASCVVTSSFHAVVFSILYQKSFCAFLRPGSESRTEDLLRDLGIDERLYHDGFAMDAPIDWRGAEEKLKPIRERSERYLLEALGEPAEPNV